MKNYVTYYMKMANLVATQSTCLDKQVGCVITTDDDYIISTGYNGAPKGIESCVQKGYCNKCTVNRDGLTRLCNATHAEINALLQAGSKAKGGKLFVTLQPCFECAKAIINAGIKEVYYLNYNSKAIRYNLNTGFLFQDTKVSIHKVELTKDGNYFICNN